MIEFWKKNNNQWFALYAFNATVVNNEVSIDKVDIDLTGEIRLLINNVFFNVISSSIVDNKIIFNI